MSFQIVTPAYAATAWGSECMEDGVATIGGIQCVIGNLLAPLPGIIALAAVFMIIFAGIRIMTAGSDTKALASAWQTFTWAVIGLILLSAVWLVLVLIERFTGAKVTEFGIPN